MTAFTDFDVDAAQEYCDRSTDRTAALLLLRAALTEIGRLRNELRMAYKKGADTAVNNVQLRAQVQRVEALPDEIESLTLPPPEFQGSEAVGLLRAANIVRAALGQVRGTGYTQEDQDNLGQCGR